MIDILPPPTFEQRLRLLLAYGFTVGLRDPRVNPDDLGHYMAVESWDEDDELCNLAIVGDDLEELVDEAFDLASQFDGFDAALADIMAGGVGLLHIDGKGAGPILR